MKLKLLLINKVSDTTYYSVNIISWTNPHYIWYMICKEEDNIYNKLLEYINSDKFKDRMQEKGFDLYSHQDDDWIINLVNIDFYSLTINDNE